MNLKPMTDMVVFEEIQPEENKSGIIITNTKDGQPKGLVLAVGKEVKNIKVGDKIIFDKFLTTEVEFEKKMYYFIKEEDVKATYD